MQIKINQTELQKWVPKNKLLKQKNRAVDDQPEKKGYSVPFLCNSH